MEVIGVVIFVGWFSFVVLCFIALRLIEDKEMRKLFEEEKTLTYKNGENGEK